MEIKINLEGDGAWEDIKEIETGAVLERIALLKGGMRSGKTSVSLLIKIEEGKYIHAQTSLAAFMAATGLIEAKLRMESDSGGN